MGYDSKGVYQQLVLGMAGLLQSKVKGDYSKVAAWVQKKKSLQKKKSDQVNYKRHNLITFCCKNSDKQIKIPVVSSASFLVLNTMLWRMINTGG